MKTTVDISIPSCLLLTFFAIASTGATICVALMAAVTGHVALRDVLVAYLVSVPAGTLACVVLLRRHKRARDR
ncbi:hypothetical protein [Mizugakiibacter sediminis]|uniref:hypothetical protein n=1 Tax=Mizugakiibacter sediminis TaxID=1475481 RepID=UPI0007816C15|nr:hypothetical protein [Mizugakiibacter sediminis]